MFFYTLYERKEYLFNFIKINFLFTDCSQKLSLSTIEKDILMRKFILPLLFLASSVNAMDFGPNPDMENEVFSKNVFVINARNLKEQAEKNVKETEEFINLSYLSEKWDEADQVVHKYLANLKVIQDYALDMIPLPMICNNGAIEGSIRLDKDSEYQNLIKIITLAAGKMPGEFLEIKNLKGDNTEGTININPVSPIISQLDGTNLLTHENATRANDTLRLTITQLASAQQELQNQLKIIKFERNKNLKAWEDQVKLLLKNVLILNQHAVFTSSLLGQALKLYL